jgi:hypothetical protein
MSQIGQAGAPVTHISQAYADRVEVRGRDLCGDLMGRLSFTDYFHLLLTGSEPTNDQRFFSTCCPLDPRAERILELADARGVSGPHVLLARCLRDGVAKAWGRPLTMNVSLPIAAVMLDLGFSSSAVKAVPILGCTAGLLAHLAEEQQEPIGFTMAAGAEEAITYVRADESPP